MFSSEKNTLFFSLLMLFSSVSFFLLVFIVWGIWDYLIVTAFLLSSTFSFAYFHLLKLALLKSVSKAKFGEESFEEGNEGIKALLLFMAILFSVIIPILSIFLAPRLGLFIIDGVICGASISNLLFHFTKERKSEA